MSLDRVNERKGKEQSVCQVICKALCGGNERTEMILENKRGPRAVSLL